MSGAAAAAIIMKRFKRIIAFMRERGAVSPDRAILESEIPYSHKWYFRKLVRAGAVKNHMDMCYLDEAAADAFLRGRRKRIILVLLAALIAAVIVILLSK